METRYHSKSVAVKVANEAWRGPVQQTRGTAASLLNGAAEPGCRRHDLTQQEAVIPRHGDIASGRSTGLRGRMAVLSSRTKKNMTTFKGFEADRYQQHDATICEVVLDFNNKAARVACTADQALVVTTLDEDVVKAWMIQESGGGDAGSLAAWKTDPVQANVPGDWTDSKTDLGLSKPKTRNEGDIKTNLKAGIILLSRKGFGKSGQAPKSPATFDGWQVALQRYNGRTDAGANGKIYSQNYADAIWARAQNPKVARLIELG